MGGIGQIGSVNRLIYLTAFNFFFYILITLPPNSTGDYATMPDNYVQNSLLRE